ncbi:Rib/alpha-like domain-containing protein [Staphylococcus hyicus]|uniref:Rib/alpha-like domain-containing protein n=1 Tax=Staphylococcus hyicus TaxID=1284 RepID=UPI00208E1923|nr:Rib/alpha-like domain-containing protein [Staphylococcus hyicus]MCO4329240.1 Rib/alpha-like domain-containing protein [Staphylococcus hyicus]MCO4337001.1 Rib/alpha-like domain-containing protein [Staphylococcus hyicus]
MTNKGKKNSKRFDYLPNRANKYSIRRFSVGTTSILIGATLLFGLDYQDALAAETTSGSSTTATSTDTSTQTTTNTNTQPTSNNPSVSSDSSTSVATVGTSTSTSEATSTSVATAGTSTSTSVGTSTSVATASTSTSTSVGTSTSVATARTTTPSTTAGSPMRLLRVSSMNVSTPMTATALTPANDVVAESNNIINADAIANGYIKTATDATNAANTLSGRAWLIDAGTPATMANGLTPVPENTPVYMQWIDTDGAVSPIYQAHTTNKLSSVDGSQVGPGAYAFDLRKAWIDANGVSHTYSAIDGQYYRLWINDFTTANGNTATMLRQAGGFYPNTFVNSVTGSNLGQFPLIGVNMQRTGIYMSIVPTNNYTTTQNWIVDNQGPLTNPTTTASASNYISGKVWLESGAGDYANSATGPNYNAPSDVAGVGYQVVMSSLTAEGAKAYDTLVNSLPKDQQTAAVRALLQANPQYISATVTGYTNANGDYTLRFPSGTLDLNNVYGFVLDPQGNLVKSYSSFTSPLFRAANANSSFAPQSLPYVRPVRNAWVNVNFAAVGTSNTFINIKNFDVTNNPAKPGDIAYVDITTAALSPLPTYIEWRDSKGNVIQRSGQVTTEQQAEAAGTFTIPSNASSGEVYTVYVVSGGNDVAADSLIVQVTQNAANYQPSYTSTTVSQGETLIIHTPLNIDGTSLPTGTTFKGGNNIPTWATVNTDGSITVVPDATVNPGSYNVPVVVTYPDGSRETVYAPVMVKVPDATVYNPTATPVNNPYGSGTTVAQVTSSVSIPGYPTTGPQPVITVNDPSQLPNGTTPGTVNVPVTVTYPDGSIDHISVAVTVGQTQATSYQPVVSPINKTYGNPTTVDDVIQHISIPGYPEMGKSVIITVDQVSALPDGLTAGQFDIPTTIVYPDGSTEKVIVPVTVAPSQATTNHPVGGIVNNPFGTPTTEAQVIDQVTVPGYSATGPQPVVTVNHPVSLPDGTVTGTVEIPVTVTYPDGSSEQIYVTVTTGNTQATQFDPVTSTIEKSYGSPTNREDILQHITVPGYPVNGDQPVVTILEPNLLPTGYVSGSFEVPVLVTYPDGSSDTVEVPVIVSTQPQNSQYEPVTSQVNKPFGTATSESDVIAHITIPGYLSTGTQPVITVDNPSSLPNGTTSGSYDVSVTVTYPDGTTDHITVPVVVGAQPQNTAFEPKTTPVDKPFGTPTTTDDITGSVTIPGYPPTGAQPVITVDNPTTLPNGTTPGTVEVPVTVTYPDGSVDKITVSVTTSESQATINEPKTTPVDKPFGTPTTVEDIAGSVTIPGYPPTGAQPIITVDNPTTLPNGITPGTVDVPVTVTYPDGSVDKITVSVTTSESQATINEPKTTPVDKPYGSPTTVEDITGSVTIPGYPPTGDQPVITVDDPTSLPNGTTPGTVEVPVTVTYPDGSVDKITVSVTTSESQASTNEPKTTPVDKSFGTPTTTDDITGSVTVPNFPPTGEQPVIKVDNPSSLPNGTTPGTVELPVTVTYPDGSQDHTTVPVTVGESQATTNEPKTMPVEKPFGTPTTTDDITGSVTIPGYPPTGAQPVITVDNPSTLPDGTTPGTVEVPVTVTYPDGSQDHTTVPVTVGESQATTNEPKTMPVEKPFGTPTTTDDITGSVTIPGYPPTGAQPVITVDNPSTLPDGTTPGTVEVPVTVTYPDGSKDHTTVPVTTGISQAEQNNPGYHDGVAKPGETIHIPQNGDQNMPNGTKYGVTPSVPSGWEIKIDEVTGELIVTPPNNAKPGTSIVTEVIVHYPDGSTEVVQVIITVGETSEKPLPSPTPHIPSTPHTGTITGEQSTPGHSICVTWPNGTVTIVPVKKDGTWTVDVPKQVEKDLNVINFVEVNHKGHVSKVNTVQNRGRDSKVSQHELPNTGEHSDTKTFIFGSLFAALGSLILFRRQRKEKNLT